jgi:hypothetical protein
VQHIALVEPANKTQTFHLRYSSGM